MNTSTPKPTAGDAAGLELAVELTHRLFEQMVSQQRAKVLRLAREVVPNIGPEDVLNPHDFPDLKAHPTFEFEDGLLSGLVAAQIAVRAELRQALLPAASPSPSGLPR